MAEMKHGKIARISVKEGKEDKFGNKYRIGLQLEGDDQWYNSQWLKKYPKLQIQKGKEWLDVGEGSVVVLTIERNGDFVNFTDMMCPDPVAPVSKPAVSSGQKPASTGDVPQASTNKWVDNARGQRVGNTLTNAISSLVAESEQLTVDALVSRMRLIWSAVDKFEAGLNGEEPKAKPKPKKPDPVEEEFPDDEIPF